MPTICAFYGILIRIMWADHAPPHFHAYYAEHEASIDIRTLQILEGHLPRKALAMVVEWAQQNHDELTEDWDLCSQKQSPKGILPLS